MKRVLTTLLYCLLAINFYGQSSRQSYTINEGWQFLNKGTAFGQHDFFVDDSSWKSINIPHTWNAHDPFDDEESYNRGIGWYRKTIKLSKDNVKNKKAFLHFEGVNQVADVFVNGIHVGRHKGGYTAFTFDITNTLKEGGSQLLSVMVNSAHDPLIPPLSVGYALYGGIYRDIWLITTSDIHFDLSDHGAKGIHIRTPEVSNKKASILVNGVVVNASKSNQDLEIESVVYDKYKKEVSRFSSALKLRPNEKKEYNHKIIFNNPNLWSPTNPYLYTVHSFIKKDKVEIDSYVNPLGLRWYSFNSNQGFFLNGKPLKLKGTNRHQDMQNKGSALSNADHRKDMELIKKMGCNFIRIAHYPQDPEILRAADELGLLAWEEIPLVNYMTINEEFLANAKHMLKEMIRQHYNHPSVIVWGSMNEIFLWGNNEDRIRKQTDSTYIRNVAKYAKELNNLIKTEDPARYSTLAMHMSGDYDKVGIEDAPQIASYNIYSGWYGGKFEDFGATFDRKHKKKPNQNIFISEYGAGSDVRLNSKKPKRFDFTGQYQRLFNESYLRQINDRPYISGSAIWNQFDFSQPHVGGSIPHLNQKGMATWDRKPKDVYYFYKANWNSKPMIHIAEKDWGQRASISEKETYEITVYSNLEKLNLYLNGRKLGAKYPDDINKTTWTVSLKAGENNLRALGKANGELIEDFATINLNNITESSSFGINVGSNAQYSDSNGLAWIQDDTFNGIYGYTKGVSTLLNRKYIIRGSNHDPLYYTYLDEINHYKVKVANGTYNVSLFFIENEKITSGERVFDVSINNNKIIEKLDIMKEVGFCYGLERTFEVEVKNNEVVLDFNAISGKPVLSGIKISKVN
jgi:beta-galactosidase